MMTGFDEVRDAKQGAISRLLDPASDGPPAFLLESSDGPFQSSPVNDALHQPPALDGPIEDAILAYPEASPGPARFQRLDVQLRSLSRHGVEPGGDPPADLSIKAPKISLDRGSLKRGGTYIATDVVQNLIIV